MNQAKRKMPDYVFVDKKDGRGNVIRQVPYRQHCRGNLTAIEIPKGSGNWFYEDGVTKISDEHYKRLGLASVPKVETKASVQDELAEVRRLLEQSQKEVAALKAMRGGDPAAKDVAPRGPSPEEVEAAKKAELAKVKEELAKTNAAKIETADKIRTEQASGGAKAASKTSTFGKELAQLNSSKR